MGSVGKRATLMWLSVLVLVAVGAGAAAGTVLGEIPIAVSQALLTANVGWSDNTTFRGASPAYMSQQVANHRAYVQLPRRKFVAVAEDNTAFQAAAEMAKGDWAAIAVPLKNASNVPLIALLTLDVPEGLEVEA